VIRTQDLKVLFRAQEVIGLLAADGLVAVPSLESVISMARQSLEAQKGRRCYLLDMLPNSVSHALPGISGRFVVEFPRAGRVELQANIPVWVQILDLERRHGERAIRLLHHNGAGLKGQVYWL
jgi:hypothetical protein